ncbi:MAG: BPTD_3080 family restriction endonuclease, partial [Geodermatophilaceae bacterium]
VTRSLGNKKDIIVINDEAHHCYREKPPEEAGEREEKLATDEKREAEQNKEAARVWLTGIEAINKKLGVRTVYDLSATPFFLRGSGYPEGTLFPWVVSDFSLIDAIESGIVKIPRVPVADDQMTGAMPTFRDLWLRIRNDLPKRGRAASELTGEPILPKELEAALISLYGNYEKSYTLWEQMDPVQRGTPPVFIVVCNNTTVSKLVCDWIAGWEKQQPDGTTVVVPGKLAVFSNEENGGWTSRPNTLLIDSAQIDSGEGMSDEFKKVAAAEIEEFKNEYRARFPGRSVDEITNEDLLREVMNTVGKKDRLGEGVRCVVSVAMLTEGWDANTVTHILGIRAFRSQLLCEQVVGRGLRRRSYAINEDGRFDPEYASVYGIPFAFIPSDRPPPPILPPVPVIEVASVPGREHLRISFPKLDGYRIEIPDAELMFDPGDAAPFEIGPSTVPTWVETSGIVGGSETVRDADGTDVRVQRVAFALARRLLDAHFSSPDGDRRPWLFPRLVTICRDWIRANVHCADGYDIGYLLTYAERQAEAVEAIHHAITVQVGNRRERLRPMLRGTDTVGSTADVAFLTRKAVVATEKSEISHVTLDGKRGNTWEQILSLECERHKAVAAYAKNDHLGFTIPYVHKGRTHSYLPDFLLRLVRPVGEPFDRTLVVEVSGGQKSPGPTAVKARTARDSWCAAVNNHGGNGRWGYVEVTSMVGVRTVLSDAITALYADAPIIGDPDLLDFADTTRELIRGG